MKTDLSFYYSKRRKDFICRYPQNGKWDANLVFYEFLTYYPEYGKDFFHELNNRGYDLSTAKFTISKKTPESPEVKIFELYNASLARLIKGVEDYRFTLEEIDSTKISFKKIVGDNARTLNFYKGRFKSWNVNINGNFGIGELQNAYLLLNYLNEKIDNIEREIEIYKTHQYQFKDYFKREK